MDRKTYVSETIRTFRESSFEEQLEQLSFGVELEYQSENADGDIDWDADYEDLYDIDAIDEYASENIYNNVLDGSKAFSDFICEREFNPKLIKLLKQLFPVKKSSQSNITWRNRREAQYKRLEYVKSLINKEYDDACKEEGCNYFDSWPDIKEYVWHRIKCLFDDSMSFDEFEEMIIQGCYECGDFQPDDLHEYLRDDAPRIGGRAEDGRHFESDTDQSVTGGELRTINGHSFNDILKITENMMENIENVGGEIDKDCSYHVHLKLGSIHHSFGKGNLHHLLMQFFVENFERLPKAVQDRLIEGNRWVKYSFDDEKYTWIHFHSQGTIEFRLFGNVDNVDDAKTCLELAAESLSYAYNQIANKGEKSSQVSLIENFNEIKRSA